MFGLGMKKKSKKFRYSEKSIRSFTSHSAYVATSTELDGVKIDGFLYPNLM